MDRVLTNMAPNLSGVNAVDQPRAMHLAELAAEFAATHLKPGGAFLAKLFHGIGFDDYVRDLRAGYQRVSIRKPKASRARSPEVYALATGKLAQDRKSVVQGKRVSVRGDLGGRRSIKKKN